MSPQPASRLLIVPISSAFPSISLPTPPLSGLWIGSRYGLASDCIEHERRSIPLRADPDSNHLKNCDSRATCVQGLRQGGKKGPLYESKRSLKHKLLLNDIRIVKKRILMNLSMLHCESCPEKEAKKIFLSENQCVSRPKRKSSTENPYGNCPTKKPFSGSLYANHRKRT
eukprot:761684-Hanusia_phi.AAC.2